MEAESLVKKRTVTCTVGTCREEKMGGEKRERRKWGGRVRYKGRKGLCALVGGCEGYGPANCRSITEGEERKRLEWHPTRDLAGGLERGGGFRMDEWKAERQRDGKGGSIESLKKQRGYAEFNGAAYKGDQLSDI